MREIDDMSVDELVRIKTDAKQLVRVGPIVLILGLIAVVFVIGLTLWFASTGYLVGVGVFGVMISLGFFIVGVGAIAKVKGDSILARFKAYEERNQDSRYDDVTVWELTPKEQEKLAQIADKLKFCPHCGIHNLPEYNYCSRCEKPLP